MCVFLCVRVCHLVCLSILARPRGEQVNSPSRMPANRPARKVQVNEKYRFPGEFGERDYLVLCFEQNCLHEAAL